MDDLQAFLFLSLRFYPCWAIPLGVILVDWGRQWNRRNIRSSARVSFVLAIFFWISAMAWILARGDQFSDAWLKGLGFGSL